MIWKRHFIALFLIAGSSLFSQTTDSIAPAPLENYFRFTYDNDLFSQTDRYYTQGILIDLVHPVIKYSPFSYALIRLSKQARNYYGLHVEQDVFTPKSITYMGGAIYYGERPYTAVFFLSHSLTSLNPQKKILLKTQLDLGIIGPDAQGEQEQKAIHKATNNAQPEGWQNQLAEDYVINYRAAFEKGCITTRYFEMMTAVTGRLGTLYTDAGVGLNFRLGLFSPYFNNLGLEKNPARKNRFKLYGFARLNAKAVGYNATLQGGLINTGSVYTLPASAINRVVAGLSSGIVIAYKRVSLEYSKTYITREFKTGLDHSWGRCAITVCF
jgi:lipid A 3-O-deacylase